MIKVSDFEGNISTWYSEEQDWNSRSGETIAVWEACKISENEYSDFQAFIIEETDADTEPIGSFKTTEDIETFVFLVKTNVSRFSIWRFNLPGMRWWYDFFSEVNGGRRVLATELTPIITKLGLNINERKNKLDTNDDNLNEIEEDLYEDTNEKAPLTGTQKSF